MRSQQAEADIEQRERQARIEQDIRQLFARYRRTGRKKPDTQRPESTRPARRFSRDPLRTTQRAG
jgi:hypothetical protein